MDLFDKCGAARLEEYQAAESLGLLPYFRTIASQSGPRANVEGASVIMLGSNNYLGLTSDPRVRQASIDAIEAYGTGCTGSRVMNGSLALHAELEDELSDWMGTESSLVFTTGYTTNLGVVGTLVGAGDAAFSDLGSHASLVDGGNLADGSVIWWRHNAPDSLRSRLARWRADNDGGALVLTEGIYSMEGDEAPLEAIASVCREFDARLLVDEAHSIGVCGPEGAGVAAARGVRPDLVVATFSKALASCGGFVAGPRAVTDYLRRACRPFQFTASGVPAAVAAALAASRLARKEDWRRETLRARAAQLRAGLVDLGYELGPDSGGAIIPVHVGADWDAVRLWRALLDAGVYVNCAITPAVPANRALLRASVMATHEEADIKTALDAFEVGAIDVGLTGATGHLGGLLLASLVADPSVETIRTVARGALRVEHPKLTHTRADLTTATARRAVEGVDVLWHLGAQLWRSRDGRQIAVNIDGTANLLAAKPGHIVLASSAAVYGAAPTNPTPITEDHPPQPNAECPYGWHKLEAERLCREKASATILRISAVLGSHADARVAKATKGYRSAIPAVRGVAQAMQFLDEADAVAALLAAGLRRPEATLNVATTDWLSAHDIARIAGGRVVALPARMWNRGADIGYRLKLLPFGADRSSLLNGPLALDPSRAMAALDWRPALSSASVLATAVA